VSRPKAGYYTAAGKRVPGVTTVIAALKGDPGGLMHWAWQLGKDGKDYKVERDNACSIGHCVHAMIEAHLLGGVFYPSPFAEILDNEDAAKKVRSAYDAYRQWRAGVNIEVIATEVPLVSEIHQYGGTLDLLARVNGALVILDWKTSNHIYGDAVAQVAAYARLVQETWGELPEAGGLLRVGKDEGDFHLHYWPGSILTTAWEAFLAARKIYDLNKQLTKIL